MASQPGFFDLAERYEQLSAHGDPLVHLNELIDWKSFLPLLKKAFNKTRKSNAGRKPYDYVLMFKLLVLQSLYNLSDHQVEYQVRDRLSFMRFLGLTLEDKVPDEKTLWSFCEMLIQGKVIKRLFHRFNVMLERYGLNAKTGMLVDATLVEVPRQRNSREENQQIKSGETPEDWKGNPAKRRQKDVEARWTQKAGQNYYGYKNHVNVDARYKLIRKYEVTSAATGDIHCLGALLDKQNELQQLWADSAYRSEETTELLKQRKIENHINHRTKVDNWLPIPLKRLNVRWSKIRKRVEHVFGFMENSMGGKFIRSIGLARAQGRIGLMNLVYNFCRYTQIRRLGIA